MSLGTMRDLSLDHARRFNVLVNWVTFTGAVLFVVAVLFGVI